MARSLGKLESVANFTEFVKAFSIFGTEMIELAHVTGMLNILYCSFLNFLNHNKNHLMIIIIVVDGELGNHI